MRVSRQFYFLNKKIPHTRKTRSTKSTKSIKSTKHKQATFTQMFFYPHKKHKSIKSPKRQTSDFLPLRCFCAHNNTIFIVLHTKKHKKHKKHIKSTKRHISEQATFFHLGVF